MENNICQYSGLPSLSTYEETTVKDNECNGNCGMNYCDENGCIDRKRNLVEPIDIDKK
jgi:hypothetical protein